MSEPTFRMVKVGDDLALETLAPSGTRSTLVYVTGDPQDRLGKRIEPGQDVALKHLPRRGRLWPVRLRTQPKRGAPRG